MNVAICAAVLFLCACGPRAEKPHSTSTRWGQAQEWQFIQAHPGGVDGAFNPHTSMYCSQTLPEHTPYCVVTAPDSLVQAATVRDTIYKSLQRIRTKEGGMTAH